MQLIAYHPKKSSILFRIKIYKIIMALEKLIKLVLSRDSYLLEIIFCFSLIFGFVVTAIFLFITEPIITITWYW
jgi:hypothetical protein